MSKDSPSSSPSIRTTSSSARECIERAAEFVASESSKYSLQNVVESVCGGGSSSSSTSTCPTSKNLMGSIPALTSSVTAMEQQVVDSMNMTRRMEQFVQGNVYAISFGAFFGAALTAGFSVGFAAASSLVRHLPTFYKYAIRRYNHHSNTNSQKEEEQREHQQQQQQQQHIFPSTDHVIAESSSLVFLQASCDREQFLKHASSGREMTLVKELLRQDLEQQSLTLAQIQRITVYLAQQQQQQPMPRTDASAQMIRTMLEKELPSHAVITIVYVIQLENERHFLHMDIIATRKTHNAVGC